MVKHIVLWTLKQGVDKKATYEELLKGFNTFKDDVPGMQSLTLHIAFAGWDICLESIHDSKEALEIYQNFPAHVEIKKLVAKNRDNRASCDFEI